MVLIKTRSGRYIASEQVITLCLEEDKMPMEGKMIFVYKILVHLPDPLLPAIVGIYLDEEQAQKTLDRLAQQLCKAESEIIEIETEV